MLATIATICVALYLAGLTVLFFFLNKRQEKEAELIEQLTKTLDDLKPQILLLQENQQTLRANDEILAKDLETFFHEFKATEKKVKILRQQQS
jgi:uncharacterized protein YoxC